MTARSQMRKLFGLHQPKTSRASRQRRRRQTQVARMLLEQLQERVMLSADHRHYHQCPPVSPSPLPGWGNWLTAFH